VAVFIAVQILLLGLAALLFDLFSHDLLCRYAEARWDPSERVCYCTDQGRSMRP
jgi:hypothetical protein